MTQYIITMPGEWQFLMSFDDADASAPISANFHDWDAADDWQQTPLQTSHARHKATEAAELVASYFHEGNPLSVSEFDKAS